MQFKTPLILLTAIILLNIPAISQAQVRPDIRFCGSTSRVGANLYLNAGSFNEISNSCAPDNNTQALFVTRSASISGNGAAWMAYMDAGGVIITEYNITHTVYNEIYGTAYVIGTRFGRCTDNAMPSEKLNPGNAFWTANTGLTETPANSEGCGYDLSSIANGEASVTALGGLIGTSMVSFAARPQGAGTLWLLEADWQDGESTFTDDSRNFMGALILGGVGGAPIPPPQLPALGIPTLSTISLLLMALGLAFFARRRIQY